MAEECQGASRTPNRSVDWMGNTVNCLSQGFTGSPILLNSTCLRVLVSAPKLGYIWSVSTYQTHLNQIHGHIHKEECKVMKLQRGKSLSNDLYLSFSDRCFRTKERGESGGTWFPPMESWGDNLPENFSLIFGIRASLY